VTGTETVTTVELDNQQSGLNANLLLKELIGNQHCLGLVRFFVVHPNGRFSKLAVIHALDENGTRRQIESALEMLVNVGVIKMSIVNDTCYYLLTRDEPTRHLVLNLAEFDWHQWQQLDHYYVADRRKLAR
jgi:hypothetical protein